MSKDSEPLDAPSFNKVIVSIDPHNHESADRTVYVLSKLPPDKLGLWMCCECGIIGASPLTGRHARSLGP